MAELTLSTVAKSTWPESGAKATDLPNAFHASPAAHVPQEVDEQERSDESKKSVNWNCDTTYCEYK